MPVHDYPSSGYLSDTLLCAADGRASPTNQPAAPNVVLTPQELWAHDVSPDCVASPSCAAQTTFLWTTGGKENHGRYIYDNVIFRCGCPTIARRPARHRLASPRSAAAAGQNLILRGHNKPFPHPAPTHGRLC